MNAMMLIVHNSMNSDRREDEADSTESKEATAEEVQMSDRIFPVMALSVDDFPFLWNR
jgi:hypothetical protein